MTTPRACDPVHEETLALGEDEFRVYRCSWGWCVKRGDEAFRSRMLLDAFEQAFGGRLEEPHVREIVGTIERALEAEYAERDETVSHVMTLPRSGEWSVPGSNR